MNLDYTKREKVSGFSIFIFVWLIGAIVIWFRASELMYPLGTKLAVCIVPIAIRVIFDGKNLYRVITGRGHPVFE